MEVKKIVWNFLDSNMYVLHKANHILVIDPVNVTALEDFRTAASLTVLLTHEHFDHICGLNRLREILLCQVIANKNCSERIKNPKTNLSTYADVLAGFMGKTIKMPFLPFACEDADIVFDFTYSFSWNGYKVELYSTPGHSLGSSCILIGNMLFSGDTILESPVVTRLPGGSKKLYKNETLPVLERLLLDVNTVYTGHGNQMTREMALKVIHEV